jgi:hypothetical protein
MLMLPLPAVQLRNMGCNLPWSLMDEVVPNDPRFKVGLPCRSSLSGTSALLLPFTCGHQGWHRSEGKEAGGMLQGCRSF